MHLWLAWTVSGCCRAGLSACPVFSLSWANNASCCWCTAACKVLHDCGTCPHPLGAERPCCTSRLGPSPFLSMSVGQRNVPASCRVRRSLLVMCSTVLLVCMAGQSTGIAP